MGGGNEEILDRNFSFHFLSQFNRQNIPIHPPLGVSFIIEGQEEKERVCVYAV